ncbi:nuclear transport factor 2 family protein [Burkholderia sp. AU19243]|uniref:nuclear transport factor 2 family protein n=2 Tax=Burkholderiaceae TaxID=119060 RepID=UPI000AAFA9EB|nr:MULTISPECIES: nuclear transport factor 2 family protein [Burkholderia]MBR7959463.1 nuclear transport factor 2 family protein [Burkholderia vietnamiensis]MBR8145633.1 nuclear transport factor 2 family protein [Burkholderia vietnamiensis]MBR8365119.1 nuclear transport factor 2 family protein [Burkholderia sp. AU19243]MBY4694945.1 nuclear transport factor 2 family protein [Burkholderia latens]MCA8308574.1 nuclear transport factor 2 family protein [Burkholderia sp. AU28942]
MRCTRMTTARAARCARWVAAALFAATSAHAIASGVDSVDSALQEANRRTVLAFYEKGLNEKDADAALAYVGDQYVQHNPNAADGRDGFRKFVAFLRDTYPQSHSEIKRSFVDGDYVILHVHAVREPGTRGSAIVDIFRLAHGKIVEHWDVNQPVPEHAANGNTMF